MTLAELKAKGQETEAGCWVWTKWVTKAGYGALRLGGRGFKGQRVHRVAMALYLGRVLERWEVVHHRCRMKACYNPEHLELMALGAHTREHHPGPRCSHQRARGQRCPECRRQWNRENNWRYRAEKKLVGECADCAEPALPGRTWCVAHRAKKLEAAKAWYRQNRDRVRARYQPTGRPRGRPRKQAVAPSSPGTSS